MGLTLRLAWRNVWRHRRRTWITASAMAVGIALCLGTLALQDGMFAQMFDALVRRQLGHAQIHAPAFPKQRALEETLPEGSELLDEVARVPTVAAAAGRVYGFALLGVGEESAGAQIIGIDPARERRLTEIDRYVVKGRYLEEGDRGSILLGEGLRERLGAGVGDEVVAVTQAADGSLGNELYRVVGVFRSGASQVDRSGAYLTLEDAQALFAIEDQLHEIALLARDADAIDAMVADVRRALADEDVLVRAWDEVSPTFAQVLGIRDIAAWIVAAIVLGVAALGVLNTMLMSVFERTRELGVLIALGLKPGRVLSLILTETLLLALLGVALGALLGGLLDLYLVVFGVDLGRGADLQYLGVAFDPVIYGVVTPSSVIIPTVMVLLVALLAALWPAARAARLEPVVAMRQQ